MSMGSAMTTEVELLPVASGAFDEDGLEQAKRLVDEIEANVPAGGDPQAARIVRVLRILADQVEELRSRD